MGRARLVGDEASAPSRAVTSSTAPSATDKTSVLAISGGLGVTRTSCCRPPLRIFGFKLEGEALNLSVASDAARLRGADIVGIEKQRFNFSPQRSPSSSSSSACGDVEAGNEADGVTGDTDRRVVQVIERLTSLGGGVGGVEIHVGGELNPRIEDSAGVLGAVV